LPLSIRDAVPLFRAAFPAFLPADRGNQAGDIGLGEAKRLRALPPIGEKLSPFPLVHGALGRLAHELARRMMLFRGGGLHFGQQTFISSTQNHEVKNQDQPPRAANRERRNALRFSALRLFGKYDREYV
jgi:hypothetical protein